MRSMEMDARDKRVKRTQKLLARALIALTLEKGYEAVTIRDITVRADVGYATFFRHYHDKDALLQDVLDVILDELTEALLPAKPDTDPALVGTLLFRYVQMHSEMIQVLLRSQGSSALMPRIIAAGTRSFLQQHRAHPQSTVPIEVVAHHLITSSVSLIQWWLEHDMPYPPEQMGRIYCDLIVCPTDTMIVPTLNDEQ